MKKLIIAAVLISCTMSASASELDVEQLKQDHCELVFGLAEKIMNARQLGVKIPTLRSIANADREKGQLMNDMITDAYNTPQMELYENQQKEIRKFANGWSAACYQAQKVQFYGKERLLRF